MCYVNSRKLIFLYILSIILFCNSTSAETSSEKSTNNLLNFLKAGKVFGNFRSYYANKDFDNSPTQKSMAVGGWLGYDSAKLYGLSTHLVGYTSQGFVLTDPDQDGTDLLQSGQKGYTVLGQAYLQAELHKTKLKLYRQAINTPFININDAKMTPITYEAYTLETQEIPNTKITLSHVTKIKGWNNSSFENMSKAAGFPETNEPVTLAGIIFTPLQKYTIQLWNYFCHEFMNVIYFQADGKWSISENFSITGSAQAMDQRDIGKSIGGDFHTGMGGLLAGIIWKGLTFKLGFTVTGDDHDTVNPWAGYPGYTSIMEEDNDLRGEKAWVVSVKYDFNNLGIKGLIFSLDHAQSYVPPNNDWFSSPDQKETDITLDYYFNEQLKGMWLRLQMGFVDHPFDEVEDKDYEEYRLILNYSF